MSATIQRGYLKPHKGFVYPFKFGLMISLLKGIDYRIRRIEYRPTQQLSLTESRHLLNVVWHGFQGDSLGQFTLIFYEIPFSKMKIVQEEFDDPLKPHLMTWMNNICNMLKGGEGIKYKNPKSMLYILSEKNKIIVNESNA